MNQRNDNIYSRVRPISSGLEPPAGGVATKSEVITAVRIVWFA